MDRASIVTSTVLCVEAPEGAPFDAVRSQVEARGGEVVAVDDGRLTALFGSAGVAVAASVAVQGGASDQDRSAIGLAAGDVTRDGDDVTGPALATAARLASAARPGDVLATAVVRDLADGPDAHAFEPAGLLPDDLVGLDQVLRIAGPASATGMLPWRLPPAVVAPGDVPLVGRDAEMAQLRALYESTAGGAAATVLIGGEAGAGKTRLAVELAQHAAAEGGGVLWGSCDHEVAAPYHPWVTIFDHLIDHLPDELLESCRPQLAHLEAVLAPPSTWVHETDRPAPADPDSEQYRLFDAASVLLGRVAGQFPLVVHLDDLHWCGAQTLALFRHLVRARPRGVLLVGTYRDTTDEITPQLTATLGTLRRDGAVARISLGGLDVVDVGRYVEAVTGRALDPTAEALAHEIAARTGGNPFLVAELWSHLAAACTGTEVAPDTAAVAVPAGVREVVAERVARLSRSGRAVAELAAVGGRQVEYAVVAEASGLPVAEVTAALDELVENGLLVEDARPGGYRFGHDLLRDALVEVRAPLTRARHRLQVAEAIERVHAGDLEPRVAHLARLYAQASVVDGPDRAVHYARRAAAQAMRSSAYDEAGEHIDAGLALTTISPRVRAGLLIQRAEIQTRSGQMARAMASAVEAVGIARAQGDARLLARAALVLADAQHIGAFDAEGIIDVCEDAISALGDVDPALARRLVTSYGRTLALAGRTAEALPLIDRSVADARAADDALALGWALAAQLVLDDRRVDLISTCDELEQVASRRGDSWLVMWSTLNVLRLALRSGDVERLERASRRHRERAARGRYPLFRCMGMLFDHTVARLRGDFALAEDLAMQGVELGRTELPDQDLGWFGVVMYCLRRDQGRLREVEPVLAAAGTLAGDARVWAAGLAAVSAEIGHTDAASSVLDEVVAGGLDAVPEDGMRPATIGLLADACCLTGHRALAEPLLAELGRWRGEVLMAGFTTAIGPADTRRAGLLRILGRLEEASTALASAEDLARSSGSVVWELWAAAERTQLLAAAGHLREAEDSAAVVRERAASVGMASLAELVVAGTGSSPADPAHEPRADGLSDREAEVLGLLAEGCSNRVIGERLHISANTAANHVRSILQKTGCANRTEAAVYATRASA